MNQKAPMACHFNYLLENEELIEVTSSYVHCKCGNISETVPDKVVVTTVMQIANAGDNIGLRPSH